MDVTESAPRDSHKFKRTLRSSTKPAQSDHESAEDPAGNPCVSKTPEKPAGPQRRHANRRAALSIKEVREMAQKLRRSDGDTSGKQSSSKSKKSSKSMKLPEKYEVLDKFFNSLDSSVRLLRLKGSKTTFTNISPQIECLTDRRFTYDHLAQMKFILPEAIEIKKVLVHDERTACMKPDLHITLNANAVEYGGKLESDTANTQLRNVFRSRLLEFSIAHPEEDEIPMELLPGPFKQSKQEDTSMIRMPNVSLTNVESNDVPSKQRQATTSHLPQGFRRHFSKQLLGLKAVDTQQELLMPSRRSSHAQVVKSCLEENSFTEDTFAYTAISPNRTCFEPTTNDRCLNTPSASAGPSPSKSSETPISNTKNEESFSNDTASIQVTPAKLESTPAKLVSTPAKLVSTPAKLVSTPAKLVYTPAKLVYTPAKLVSTPAKLVSTPAKLVSTPTRFMSATPALQPPKRCFMSPDNDSACSPDKLVRRPPRSRSLKSLKFDTPMKNAVMDANRSESCSTDEDLDILPETLLQELREKERIALEEQDPAISKAKRRKKMISSLPKLFDTVRFLFQSIRRSVITKEELLQRLITSHVDIVDRREVEEQMQLLQELAPEWIQEKSASSGDLLVCINRTSGAESIRARLVEAK